MTKTIRNTVSKISFLIVFVSSLFSCADLTDEKEFIADTIPIAAFTTIVDVDDWRTYTFTNISTNGTSYVWDFGDSTTSVDVEPTHTYSGSGTYKVKLTVSDDTGDTDTIERTVIVSNPNAAMASFTVTADTNDWKIFTFNNLSINGTTYIWDFGDNSTSIEFEPIHTYAAAGTYIVKLEVKGDVGDSSIVEQTIEVIDPDASVTATFKAQVLNSTCNDWSENTSDNSDAWDMTPNSTIIDNSGQEIDSPYRAIWYNSDLATWLETNCGDPDEQPGSTSDGNKFGTNAGGGRGVKLNEVCRRLYQVVTVEPGVEYTFTIDTRSEAVGVNTEVFILNNEITNEDAINTVAVREVNADGYYLIDNDFNSSKSSSTNDTFTTSTFTFIASTSKVVIYVKSSDAIDSSNEVFIDNIDIITPGF